MDERFLNQTRLMLRCIPAVNKEKCFALKGGTAINFFLHDMPRLSVDIDLTYLPIEPRKESLKKMGESLTRIAQTIRKTIPESGVQEIKNRDTQEIFKLLVTQKGTSIKIEPNMILRGTVFPITSRPLAKKAVDLFRLSVSAQVLSTEDLYGGKICAALDRQHPRDLFDVIDISKKKLDEKLKQAFLVYLISHDRAMSDLLSPEYKDIGDLFIREFKGMTEVDLTVETLNKARTNLVRAIQSSLTPQDKDFLISLKLGEPKWDLLPLPHIKNLPSVQWKLLNIRKMKKEQQDKLLKKLQQVLG